MPEQKPSVGRIVTYRTRAGVDCAAIITAVPGSKVPTPPDEEHVHLEVFYPRDTAADYVTDGGVPCESRVPELLRPADGHWRWPERV